MIPDKQLDAIVNLIELHEELVIYDYKGKENQILITKELVEIIDRAIQSYNLKDMLKIVVRDAFELSPRDLVIRKNGNLFIKLLDKITKNTINEEDKGTIVSRYDGIDEEELDSFYQEFFFENENKDFFVLVAKEFTQKYFLEEKINNANYEKHVFEYIQKLVYNSLVSIYDNDDLFFNGFAGYVFRIHFKEVFEYISDFILDEISSSNTYMMDFLNYYSSDIVVLNNVRYRVPNIEAESGLRWSGVSMLSIAKIYSKSKKSIKDIKKKMNLLDAEVSELYVNEVSPVEYHSAWIKAKQELDNELEETNRELDKYRDSLDLAKNKDETKKLNAKIVAIKNILVEIREERQALTKKMLAKSVIKKYTELQKKLDALKRQFEREKKLIAQNKDAYLSMRDSLVKALISKKQAIT